MISFIYLLQNLLVLPLNIVSCKQTQEFESKLNNKPNNYTLKIRRKKNTNLNNNFKEEQITKGNSFC